MPTERPLAELIQTYWKKALLAELGDRTRRNAELSTMLETEAVMEPICVACDEVAAARCTECGEHFCTNCFGGSAAVEAGGACPWCAVAIAKEQYGYAHAHPDLPRSEPGLRAGQDRPRASLRLRGDGNPDARRRGL